MATDIGVAYFNPRRELRTLRASGADAKLPEAHRGAVASLAPVNRQRLTDRLTALGMMMAPNRAPAEAAIWLKEMTRLLADLPEDALADAIDTLVKRCRFLPTCAEIRELAEPIVERRRRIAAQIEAMLTCRNEADGPAAPRPEFQQCPPEEADRIMREFNLRDVDPREAKRHLGPPKKPTRQDYLDMGVSPEVLDRMEAAAAPADPPAE